jgi:hypothetical protein
MSVPASADTVARVQLIVDVLARAVNRAVLLDDASLTPISYSRQLGQLDDVRTHSVLQRGTPSEIRAELAAMGIATAAEAFWTPAVPEKNMMPRFCVPVCSPGDRFAYLWVLDPDKSLSEQGQQLARQAGQELEVILDRRNAGLRAAESVNQVMVGRLLACDTVAAVEELLPELQEMGIAQPDSLVSVFAFTTDAAGPRSPVERTMALRLRLATTATSHNWLTLAGRPHAIVAVSKSGAPVDTAHLPAAVVRAVEHCYGQRPGIGWSGVASPISEAAQAFQHARLAMGLSRIGVTDDDVVDWTVLGSWRALALLVDNYSDRPADLVPLIHPGIVDLVGKGREDLIHTLDVYLALGGDARKTADTLHLHRSTLYYRLEKITEAVGGDLGDGEARFGLMLGIRLAYFAGLYAHSAGSTRSGVFRQLSEGVVNGSDVMPMRSQGKAVKISSEV